MKIAMLPGDARQDILSELLKADGYEVFPYVPGIPADAYLFPLPTGNHPVLSALPHNALALTALAQGRYPHLRLRDYFAVESVQLVNAAITAETALTVAQAHRDRVLNGSNVLILGFGRIGQALAPRLKSLGAEVTVYARRPESRALARSMGCCALPSLPERVAGFDLAFNTIPAQVFPAAPDCLTIELASAPGGFRDAGGVVPAPGLPGKLAPRSAAEALHDSVLEILRKEGAH